MIRVRRILTGWRLFIIALVLFAALLLANDYKAVSAPLRGFYPSDTTFLIATWDAPRAWREIEGSDVFMRMRKDWPRPHADLELAARLRTGVRPTPVRIRVWLGRRAVVALAPEGVGVTAYPGFFLRMGDRVRRILGHGPDADGISSFRSLHYAWRDGYLIASQSREFVVRALEDTDSPRLRADENALLTLQWAGEYEGFVHLRRGAGLPINGQLRFAATDGTAPLTLPNAWPNHPAATLSCRDLRDAQKLWTVVASAATDLSWAREPLDTATALLRAWNIQVPPDWDSGAEQVSLALFGMVDGAVPVPECAMAMRFADPAPDTASLTGLVPAFPSIAYTWNGAPGALFPLLGADLSPCVARTERDWLVATREPVMAAIAGGMAAGPACRPDVDVAVRVSWEQLAAIAESVAPLAGEYELFPRIGKADVQARVTPKLNALSALGELSVDGVVRETTLSFTGYLARPIEGTIP